MRIGINTCLWLWPFNFERVELFKKIEDLGFDGVEMTIEDRSEKNLGIIKDYIQKTNLSSIVCSSFVKGNLIDDDYSGKKYFDDVSENDWFFNYVSVAKENKIINGYKNEEDPSFMPHNFITRAETSLMLVRIFNLK